MKKLILVFMVFFALIAYSQSTHTIDFEPAGVGADWDWIVGENGTNPVLEFPANPAIGGLNTSATVAKFTALQTGAQWALCYTDDDGQFIFDATNSTVKIMIYKTVISNVAIKFEGLSGAAEIPVANTLINQWEEITFDFSAHIGKTFSRLVIIPDFAPRTEDHIIYFDNIQVPDGEEVGPLPEPTTVPPTPTQEEEDVIAIYTEDYTNLPGTNFNPNWGQSTTVTVDYNVAGNNTLKYENLNYQGTQYTNQDVSLFDSIHLDFWTPNATILQFYLISPGNETFVDLPITLEEWVSVDIALQDFVPPVNLANVFQFKVVGNGTVYFDNWYFWKEPIAQGTDATLSDLKVNGTTIPGFSPLVLNYNVELPFGTTLVPTLTATTNDPNASIVITNPFALPGTAQVKVTAQDGITMLTYVVNYSIASPEPTTAPPVPDHPEADVMSIYTEVYTNIDGVNFDPYWNQQTIVTLNYSIAGNNTLRYEDLDFQGTEFPTQDVSGYEFFHVDFWTANSTELNFFLISQGPVQDAFPLTIEPETWVSVDLPIADLSPPVDLTQLYQFMVTGNGDVYFDNWYFWRNPVNPEADATLSDLLVDGTTVEGFSPSVLTYAVELPFGSTEVPVVDAVTTYAGATFVVNDAPGLPGTTEVVVTSEDETNTLTYSIEFTVGPETPLSDYCYTEVFHFGGDPSSGIFLTIANVDANSMIVEIESADDDPVDLLLVNGGSGAIISEEDTLVPGIISRTLTWADTPPTDVTLNVLWSKDSFGGNWQLSEGDITVPFIAGCEFIGPPPVTFFPQDGATSVPLSVNPTLTFSTPVEMADGAELTNADIPAILTFNEEDAGGQAVAYTATINDEKTLITIVPDADLEGELAYYLALGNELIRLQDSVLIAGQSVTFITEPAPKPYLELDVQDNFENDGYATVDNWKFQDGDELVDLVITEDPKNASNHVADYTRSGTFLYTNAQVILDHRMDLTERNTFELKAYFPSTNDYSGALIKKAAIKLQNSLLGALAYTTQAEVLRDVNVLNAWVTLTFDFSDYADSVDYDQIVVQLGGENHLVPAQFYFDNLRLKDIVAGPHADFIANPVNGYAPLIVQFTDQSTFNASSWQWDFENDGIVDATVKNPVHTYQTPGTYSVRLVASNPFIGTSETVKENYILVAQAPLQQMLQLNAGWSGISSFVVPENGSIQSIFGNIASDIEIIVGDVGIYYPSQSIYTLENWDAQQGYLVKMLNSAEVNIVGSEAAAASVAIPSGWSLVPVTSACEVNITDLFGGFDQLVAIKEVAGTGMYWPEKGINTLMTLSPGKAYYILTSDELTFTYPECPEGYNLIWSDEFEGSEVKTEN